MHIEKAAVARDGLDISLGPHISYHILSFLSYIISYHLDISLGPHISYHILSFYLSYPISHISLYYLSWLTPIKHFHILSNLILSYLITFDNILFGFNLFSYLLVSSSSSSSSYLLIFHYNSIEILFAFLLSGFLTTKPTISTFYLLRQLLKPRLFEK